MGRIALIYAYDKAYYRISSKVKIRLMFCRWDFIVIVAVKVDKVPPAPNLKFFIY